MMHQQQALIRARFVSRPNRFIAIADIAGEQVVCHMPNTGRMWELLYPGAELLLRRVPSEKRKTPYDVTGVLREGIPILLDTQYTNDTAEWLVREKKIPGWEDWDFVRREVTVGDSRFDLLLRRGTEWFYLEVKSCTLFGKNGAMFPDAVTERGRKHIRELAEMHDRGIHTGLLILVHWERARWFLPDYHTDPDFAETFRLCAPKLDWKALALQWDPNFTRPRPAGLLAYPEDVLCLENQDGGDYFLILELPEVRTLSVGALGNVTFPAGYYVYVGSARKNLSKRLERHRRKRKHMHWHIDVLRDAGSLVAAIPVRTVDDLEHEMAARLSRIAEWSIPGFGCTDCLQDGSHLFGFHENPVHLPDFLQVLEDFRINRIDAKVRLLR